jgi:hypothetical protein
MQIPAKVDRRIALPVSCMAGRLHADACKQAAACNVQCAAPCCQCSCAAAKLCSTTEAPPLT